MSIRLAVACAQTGSLSAAARGLHLALAAASRRIRELETALANAQFQRHARGMLPTPAGYLPSMPGLHTQLFRHDEPVLPAGYRLAGSKSPLAFANARDEEWISLTSGSAMLRQQ